MCNRSSGLFVLVTFDLRTRRIARGGADRGVPEQDLNQPDISASLEQVGGERVPQHVRRHALAQLELAHRQLQRLGHRVRVQWPPFLATWEQPSVLRARDLPIPAQYRQQPLGEHHIAVLAPLADSHVQYASLAVDVFHPQPASLADPEPGRVRRGQRHPRRALDRRQDLLHLAAAQHHRLLVRHLRCRDPRDLRRAIQRHAVEELDRRDVAPQRRRMRALQLHVREILFDLLLAEVVR